MDRSSDPSGPTLRWKLLFAIGTPLLLFGAFELALRLARFEFLREEPPILIWNPLEDRRMGDGKGLHVADAVELWKPRPAAEIPWAAGERVNDAGWRGPRLEPEKTPGVLRVATLGDSSTFGHSVAYPECYSARLEQLLRAAGQPAEVMNCGVVGFTVRQGLERYRELVRAYHPDVVVAAFGSVNEHHGMLGLPDVRKIQRGKGATDLLGRLMPRVRTLQFLAWLRFTSRGGEKGARDARLRAIERERELVATVGQLDWPGQRRVSLEDFDRALTELGREVEADGGRLVLLSMPRVPLAETNVPVLPLYSERLLAVAEREDIPVLDARAAFQELFAAGTAPEELFVGDWWHPNAAGHELLARGLAPLVIEASTARD